MVNKLVRKMLMLRAKCMFPPSLQLLNLIELYSSLVLQSYSTTAELESVRDNKNANEDMSGLKRNLVKRNPAILAESLVRSNSNPEPADYESV
jgi:hypothetical protein